MFQKEIDGNQSWYLDEACTILHREDEPAVINSDGTKQWFINGKRHRIDGPAFITTDGYEEWFKNGKYHRKYGPAIYNKYGHETWMINGQYHRLNGPAIINPDANIAEWWYYDVYAKGVHSKEEFDQWIKYKSFL